jgi:hypothetical protein
MIPATGRAAVAAGRRHGAWIAAATLTLAGFGLTGCSLVRAVNHVRHLVETNRGIINTFTNSLKSGEAATFEATYVTTGSSPTTVVYAVKPPDVAFQSTPSGAGGNGGAGDVELIVNSQGEFSCARAGSGSTWQCAKLDPATAAVRKAIFTFYTPAHWVAFLQAFALAAGFAGDKVTTSSMTVNGFSMSCVDFRASGIPGTSTICTTSAGILGYVKVASNTTSFQLKSYTTSPASSLFTLPQGAKITNLKNGG